MKKTAITLTVLLAAASSCAVAQTPQRDFRAVEGAYVGGAIGAFGASVTNTTLRDGTSGSKNAIGGKLFTGYQLTENFGVELGFIRSSTLKRTFIVDSANVEQKGNVSAFYAAGTGRFALNDQVAIRARAGIARGKFSGTNTLPATATVIGSKTGVILGVGAEYRITPKLAATLDFDYLPKTSSRLKSSLLSAGVKVTF